jgi:hypothetical protein
VRRRLVGRALRILSIERGAPLWATASIGAAILVLLAMRIAPGGFQWFTRTTSLRVAVGPCLGAPEEHAACEMLLAEFRRELLTNPGVTLVEAGLEAGVVSDTCLESLRSLNARVGVQVDVAPAAPRCRARLVAVGVRERATLLDRTVEGATPAAVGRALGDSLLAVLFAPRRSLAAAAPPPLGSSR